MGEGSSGGLTGGLPGSGGSAGGFPGPGGCIGGSSGLGGFTGGRFGPGGLIGGGLPGVFTACNGSPGSKFSLILSGRSGSNPAA